MQNTWEWKEKLKDTFRACQGSGRSSCATYEKGLNPEFLPRLKSTSWDLFNDCFQMLTNVADLKFTSVNNSATTQLEGD